MIVNGKEFDPMQAILNAGKQREENDIKFKQEVEKLKIIIMVDWDQKKSHGFWKKCFELVPFDVIKRNYDYILNLKETGYPVKNPGGLFVTLMKKQGYFPFKEVIRNEPRSN